MRHAVFAALLLDAPAASAQTTWTALTGRVLDAVTGEPVAGATVWNTWCGQRATVPACLERAAPSPRFPDGMPTDEQGRFEFRAASLRVYVVTVTHPDYCLAILPPYDGRERIPRQHRFLNLLNETDSQMSAAAQETWLEWMHNDLMAVPHVDVLLMRRPCTLGE